MVPSDFTPKKEGASDVIQQLERKTHKLLEESTILARKRDFGRAVDAATAAVQTERQLTRLREDDNPDSVNTDITYAVQVNLGTIYTLAGMHTQVWQRITAPRLPSSWF